MALIFHFNCILKFRLQFVSIWTSLKFCRLVNAYTTRGESSGSCKHSDSDQTAQKPGQRKIVIICDDNLQYS